LLGLAETAEGHGNVVGALDWIERCIASGDLGPLEPRVHYNHGRYLENLKRYEEAVAAYRRCLDVSPKHFWAIHNLGLTLVMHLGRPAEGRPYLHQALDMLPTSTAVPVEMRSSVEKTLEAWLQK